MNGEDNLKGTAGTTDCPQMSFVFLKSLNARPADLSIGPPGDELHHPVSIQVKGVDAHCMILRLFDEGKTHY